MRPGRIIALRGIGIALLAVSLAGGTRAVESNPQVSSGSAIEFFIAPNGNDANPGTREEPFASLDHARDWIAQQVAAGLHTNLTIFLRGGTYYLPRPLLFGPKHSGTDQFSITFAAYPGEQPIISGGRHITDWKRGTGDLWTTDISDVKAGKWYFRQLFVNGKRAVRARTPNVDAAEPYYRLKGAQVVEQNSIVGNMNISVSPEEIGPWQHPSDIEVNILGEWAPYRKRLRAIDARDGIVWLASPQGTVNSYNMPKKGNRCYFENALELLDEPNEWYLDKQTGTLYYWPEPGVNPNSSEIVAPVLTRLMEIHGTPKLPVKNLRFDGLTFVCCDWPLPLVGFLGRQSACYLTKGNNVDTSSLMVDAALFWQNAQGCSFVNGRIEHVGGSGIWLEAGCKRNLIEGNVICDVGANGLMLGTKDNPGNPVETTRANRVANNIIYACGIDYQSAVGIWGGLSAESVVSHNELYDLPYSGISFGWKWDPTPTICGNNLIEYNDVHHFMKTLSDGGAIYTLGFQPGTIIQGNLIRDTSYHGQGSLGAMAFYFDEGSKGFYVENNITCDSAGAIQKINSVANGTVPKDWIVWGTNYLGVSTLDVHFPRDLADKAGLEPNYRQRLAGDRETDKK